MMDPVLRHVAACNNAVLPGVRVRLHVEGAPIGWVEPALVPMLLGGGAERGPDGLTIGAGALTRLARARADAGDWIWRHEDFDVRSDVDDGVVMRLDRGALPAFGVRAAGVHLNGIVERADGAHLWVARRAADKLLDPGKLDHLVGGGIPAGLSPMEALLKEAAEEAGLDPAMAAEARPAPTIEYAMDRDEGLRRDRLYCYDLVLPASFVPEARDGEVESFELWPMQAVLERVRATDDFKFNVNLVLIDLFRRRGLLPDT